MIRVLFSSTENAARSQMAEALLRQLAGDLVDVYSAGTAPRAAVHPVALEVLRECCGVDPTGLYPKPVAQFLQDQFDYVITISDRAHQRYPLFPGNPRRIRWTLDDPSLVEGKKAQRRAFEDIARQLTARLRVWLAYAIPRRGQKPSQNTLALRRSAPSLRSSLSRRFRTMPPADAPLVMVVYFGQIRRCTNMCTFLERSGFQVYCGDIYGREPEAIALIPDVVLVRSDSRTGCRDVRLEFDALRGIRQVLPRTPIIVALAHGPSPAETDCADEMGTRIVQAHGGRYTQRVVEALDDVISRPRS